MSATTPVYYTRRGATVGGPYSPAEISKLAASGHLMQSDFLLSSSEAVPKEVATEAPGWVRAGSFSQLNFSSKAVPSSVQPSITPSDRHFSLPQPQNGQRVILTGIDIPLWDLIKLSIEWLVAVICAALIVFSPALILLLIILVFGLFGPK